MPNGVRKHSCFPSPKGLTSDSSPSQQEFLSKEGQPHALWKLGHLCSGQTTSTWQKLQNYQQQYQLNGEGIIVAILDSGINQYHAAFAKRILLSKSFVSGDGSVLDTNGHGTMCAGIACGAQFEGCSENNWIGGIAPCAKLVVCKVVPNGSIEYDPDAVCNALDYIKNHNLSSEHPVNVVSLSFGTSYYDHKICSRVHDLVGMGVIVVCAASNQGRLKSQPISFPARLGQVLCIGSHDINGKASSFSAVGREIDFLAPGENVCTPSIGDPQAMSSYNGTSCSAPAVAGLICLVLQYLHYLTQVMNVPLYQHAHNVWVMREILKEMASSSGHNSEEHGFGSLEPAKFFDKLPEEIKRIILKMVQEM